MSSKKFDKKNAQTFTIVHRPHDDPRYYDSDASERMLLPLVPGNEKTKQKRQQNQEQSSTSMENGQPALRSNNPFVRQRQPDSVSRNTASRTQVAQNQNAGEAMLYGIDFDDSSYDYTQHLKPIGLDPENSVFVAKNKKDASTVNKPSKKDIASMFTEERYKEAENITNVPVFKFGRAKPEYLQHQVDIDSDLKGFKPDMDPALREILEALEDDAYVINDDVVVDQKALRKLKNKDTIIEEEEEEEDDDEEEDEGAEDASGDFEGDEFDEGDEDIFQELLQSGAAGDEEAYEVQRDEWDLDNYEDQEFGNTVKNVDLSQFDQDLSKFDEIGWGSDFSSSNVNNLQKNEPYNESINDFGSEDDEGDDRLGDLPSLNNKGTSSITGKSTTSRKQRRKKGAMSDTSGFSMSSSCIARTEIMTVLDDKYDEVIESYHNYEEEQEDSEYEQFDMSKERSDFGAMLDDFLDNYELGSGGRKIVRKCEEKERYMKAADSVSKSKLAMRRRREQELLEQQKEKNISSSNNGNYKNDVNNLRGITGGLSSLKF